MDIEKLIGNAKDALTVRRVYGDPYEKEGVTFIPAARVAGGGGGGSGRDENGPQGEGGGFGMNATPSGGVRHQGRQGPLATSGGPQPGLYRRCRRGDCRRRDPWLGPVTDGQGGAPATDAAGSPLPTDMSSTRIDGAAEPATSQLCRRLAARSTGQDDAMSLPVYLRIGDDNAALCGRLDAETCPCSSR